MRPLWTRVHIRVCHHTWGTELSLSPFSMLQRPVFAGFGLIACGHTRLCFRGFWSLLVNFSLFSLQACGRVHELSSVFMRCCMNGFDLSIARAKGTGRLGDLFECEY